MTFDRIDWHSENNFPSGLPSENGGTHIGMFLAWVINNGLIGLLHIENPAGSFRKIISREITGRDFLTKECDGKFWSEDLNEEGRKFSAFYYASEDGYGQYVDDYSKTFNHHETLYHVEDNWQNYDLIATIITKRYNEWKLLP